LNSFSGAAVLKNGTGQLAIHRVVTADDRRASVSQAVNRVVVFIERDWQYIPRESIAFVAVEPRSLCDVPAARVDDDLLKAMQES
jgi:hypothetical protein